MEEFEYAWSDYAFVAILIAICLAISAYFGVKGTKTLAEYVWGAGELGAWPIGLSLVASNISSMTLMVPNELYQYGSTIVFEVFMLIITTILIKLQIPVLYKLKLMSLNDYVEMRFGTKVKTFTSLATLLSQLVYLTLVGFSMALFFSEIMGVDVIKCYFFVITVCYFFAALGGFRGVVWTDTFQALLVIVCLFIFIILGCVMAGGPTAVYEANLRGGRFFVSWSVDPTERLSVWSAFFGLGSNWLTGMCLFSPYAYQRYAALPSKKLINKTLTIHTIGVFVSKILSYSIGYALYATYEGCDPVRSGRISRYDQTFAYFVRNIGNRFTIVRIVYIVGFACAAVSTLTTIINTLSILIYKDFIQKRFNRNNLDERGKNIMRVAGLVFVGLSCAVVLFVQHAGTLTELRALLLVPTMTRFCILLMAMFMPRVRSKCVLLGGIFGLVMMQWLSISSKVVYARGLVRYPLLQMNVDKCLANETNFIQQATQPSNQQDVFYLYRITGFYHAVMLFVCIFSVTGLFHCIYGPETEGVVDKELISPLVHRFIREEEVAAAIPLRAKDEQNGNIGSSCV